MIYFSADYHFGHKNIIKYCDRPFGSVDEMQETIIKNHNAIVGEEDEVFILGDFSLAGENHRSFYENTLEKMHGKKHLVLGNHDRCSAYFYNNVGFHSVHFPYLQLQDFVLCHDPALSQAARDTKFFCGHVHGLFTVQQNALNVGVDVHDFKPISLDSAKKFFDAKLRLV